MCSNYVSCWIHGGIGNQLFQIANALYYSNKYNKILIFKNEKSLWNFHNLPRYTAWDTLFNNKLNVLDEEQYNKINFDNKYEEKRYNMYDEIPILNDNVYLKGYFQSNKYFDENIKNKMNELIYSNEKYVKIADTLYNLIKKNFDDYDDNNYSFIHIRRTDYINNCCHNLLDMEYYKKGINIIGENKIYVIFSDDIDWCKNNLDFINKKYFITIQNIYIELILMSLYKNGIIANSTFSWWGAFINGNDKKIIAPNKWFADTSFIKEWEDIYDKNWIRI